MIKYNKHAIFHVKCGNEQGTAFLIKEGIAITAFHVVKDYEDEGCEINLSNDNYKQLSAVIISTLEDKYREMDVAILEINGNCNEQEYIKLANSNSFPKMTIWETRGYLAAKGMDGLNILPQGNTIITSFYEKLTEVRNRYDIDLSVDNKVLSYEGMSGSPFLIDNYAYGIITTQNLQQGQAFEISALSIKNFSNLLLGNNIPFTDRELTEIDYNIDDTATDFYDSLKIDDSRTIKEKITDVCKDAKRISINNFGREAINSNVELEKFPIKYVNSLKFRIFEACQRKLLILVEKGLSPTLTIEEIRHIVDQYTEEAHSVIIDRSTNYKYPVNNKDSIRKIILSLIDECYLSFDEKGLYEED
ncbi:serine protease [Photobacterium profundum]|uniref:trypsin-like serine protease n=1 Tax=Photobacterium profundum TaxID=74109 RepID=UPI003D09A0FA